MAKLDIYSDDWCNMVFESKNKDYGAFQLRSHSSKRHGLAILIASLCFMAAITSPSYLKYVIRKKKEVDTSVRMMDYLNMDKPKENKADELKAFDDQEKVKLRNTIQFVAPVIKKDEEVKDEDQMKKQQEVVENKAAVGAIDYNEGTNDVTAEIPTEDKLLVDEATEQPFTIVEQMPDFPGGYEAMQKFMHDNLKYPPIASENGISGTVYIRFVVSRSGKIRDVNVLRGVDPALDKEAIRVVASMPDWRPGKQNGQPVPVYFTVPVKFVLQ